MLILFLLLFPLLIAGALLLCRKQKVAGVLIRTSVVLIIAAVIVFVVQNFGHSVRVDASGKEWISYLMLGIELIMSLYIVYVGVKSRNWLLSLFSAAQIILLFVFTFGFEHGVAEHDLLHIDILSMIMILIIGIIGGLICIYTIRYMKEYHVHHTDVKDRRWTFYGVLFIFLAAMFGLVMSNDMVYMLFFWEITSFCSYLLIGYTKTAEAKKNSEFALLVNVGGGLAFTIAIMIFGIGYGVDDLASLSTLSAKVPLVALAVFLLAIAGLTKSAQMPFSKWLLGAMVAPTPSSAMLHSSTMVKAGVYLIIRIAPLLGSSLPGVLVTAIGGLTFLFAAMLAVSQRDAKKLLAYSTVSNLGLIVTCAGINTPESIWAAIMLIVFHAVAKSLLFLTVGSTEYQLGSRQVEDMDGLYHVSFNLTMLLTIGIAGMFLAPFGMLISKWAAMKAFLDSGNVLVVLIVAFGSTITLFFWAKWLGRLVANNHHVHAEPYVMKPDEKVSLFTLAALVILACLLHPLVSRYAIVPYIDANMHMHFAPPIGTLSTTLILLMLGLLFLAPTILIPLYKRHKVQSTSIYMAGENTGDNESFYGSMGQVRKAELRNWYMEDMFGDKVWVGKSTVITAAILGLGFVMLFLRLF